MEEDIKILQDKDLFWKYPEKRILQAIENLINRNKELEEENRTLKRANSIAEDISIEDITQVMNKAYKDFIKEFIPTSLVKEKIEETKSKGICKNTDFCNNSCFYYSTCNILQDLLESRGKYGN